MTPQPHSDRRNLALPSIPLWMTGCAVDRGEPRKKTFEDLVAKAEAASQVETDEIQASEEER